MRHIEVEFKYKVRDREALVKKLEVMKAVLLNKDVAQRDVYYSPAHRDFYASPPMPEWLRIRSSSQGDSITYKNFHIIDGVAQNYCDEYEFKIDDLGQAKLMFNALNITPRITVEKVRDAYALEHAEVVIDEIKDVGCFCEIETKGVFTTPEEANQYIIQLGEQLGLTQEDIEPEGYPLLVLAAQEAK